MKYLNQYKNLWNNCCILGLYLNLGMLAGVCIYLLGILVMTMKLILFLTIEYLTYLLSSNRLFQSLILILLISRLTLFSKMVVGFLGRYWKMYSLRQFKLLMLLRLHKFPCDDQWLWKDNIVGKATAKAAYKYFRMQTQQEVSNRKDQ